MARFSRDFFLRPTLEVARELLGARLTTTVDGEVTSGRIVEVEGYHGPTDPAAHAFRGRTPRNEMMFARGGRCYVYLIYGLHYCVNVVTEAKDIGAAVLIRAVEPVEGIEVMHRRRGAHSDPRNLTRGPARLCQAFAIGPTMLGADLRTSPLIRVTPDHSWPDAAIATSPRIGISKGQELQWRFFVRNNRWVS